MSSYIEDLRSEGWTIKISDDLVTVTHILYGEKSTEKGRWPDDETACQLASELINENKPVTPA